MSKVEEQTLADEILELVKKHGRKAVLQAAHEVGRRSQIEATPEEKRRLTDLFNQLPYDRRTFNPFAFVGKQFAAGIPTKVSIEILERIVAVKPKEPWALVEVIMRDDYPGFPWGTSRGGPRKIGAGEDVQDVQGGAE